MTMSEELVHRPLFGGALSVTIPARLDDISQFRQVPDTQEVFADANTDQSVVVELLEPCEAEDGDAAKFHFNSLASDNEASETLFEETVDPSPLPNG